MAECAALIPPYGFVTVLLFVIERVDLRPGYPIRWQDALGDEPVEAGVRPVRDALCMAVLDRVVMDVVDMRGEIFFIPDHVLPESPLSDAAFALDLLAQRERFTGRNASQELPLDQGPADGEIGVVGWQGPDVVQVIG